LLERKKEREIFFNGLLERERGNFPMPYDTLGQRNLPVFRAIDETWEAERAYLELLIRR